MKLVGRESGAISAVLFTILATVGVLKQIEMDEIGEFSSVLGRLASFHCAMCYQIQNSSK